MTVNAEQYRRRRADLMAMMGPGSIAILPAAGEAVRNRDVLYPYRQDSDFYYLSGFAEPESVLVLAPGGARGECVLFCRERDPAKAIWDGERAGQDGAINDYGADDAFSIDDIDELLPAMIEGCGKVYCTLGENPAFDAQLLGWIERLRQRARAGVRAPSEFVALEHLLHEMRLFKSRAEIGVMRKAASIAAQAHTHAMRICKPGMTEYQLEADLLYTFHRHRAVAAYGSIVGGGANGCVLHYVDNAQPLRDGDLVLIDAGAEYAYYASDITRTFPVNGRFSQPQRAVYDCVLAAQQAAIDAARPGCTWNDPHTAAVRVLTQGMIDLGLLSGTVEHCIDNGAYRRFYMHRTGHWLGMDVHDVGDYQVDGQWRELEPGMVFTVEPGLYITPAEDVDERFWNIGVRIEDDVLITRDGCEVLTGEVVKSADDIERLMAQG